MEKYTFNRYTLILLFLLLPSLVFAGAPSSTYTYTTGQKIMPNEVQQETTNIYRYLQVGVDTYADNSIVSADIQDGTITNADMSTGLDAIKIGDGSISNSEFQYLNGVTSAIQTQINTKGDILYSDTRFYVGSFTHDLSLTGTQQVTVGFQSKAVIFFSTLNTVTGDTSWGMDDGITVGGIGDNYFNGADTYVELSTQSIYALASATASAIATITTTDATTFTLTWTKTGSPTGTITVHYLAFR